LRVNDAGNISERSPFGKQKEALKYILDFTFRSAQQGNLVAEDRIWMFFALDNGYLGYPKDLVIARKWVMKAAAQGSANAELNLGYCYDPYSEKKLDFGIPKDEILARYWYGLAAAQGITEAMNALARLDSENKPVTLVGFLTNQPLGKNYSETLEMESPVTLGGVPHQGVRLSPIQATGDRYLVYGRISGSLHWKGYGPQVNVDKFEKLPDQVVHVVNYLMKSKDYYPDKVNVQFKHGTRQHVMDDLLSSVGNGKTLITPEIKNYYSVKLHKGITVKNALKKLLNNPAVIFAAPNYMFKL